MTLPHIPEKPRCLLTLVALLVLIVSSSYAATSVTQFGITWKFDRDYPVGQFANGDYWVVGPVKITSISPLSTTASGVTMHGSMINPTPNAAQGFDSRIKNNTFAATSNIAAKFPFSVSAGSSLLSSESYVAAASGDNPQLKTIAILTVLGAAAPAGSFRPPYDGTDKSLRWNKSQLRYSKLRSLAPVANTPALSSVEALFERPWIEVKTNWTGRYMHPGANQPTYGRELSHALAQGLLSLQLNYSAAQKEKLLVRMVQYGIDIYGAVRAGASWGNDGGHNQGRKMPLLLAGSVLGDNDMIAYSDAKQYRIFQEDQQTWYVSSSDVGRPLYHDDGRPRVEYVSSDVGTPEWGEKHTGVPNRDGRNWDAYYRDVSGCSTIGHVLTARLMGVESNWNWPATFDYYERYWRAQGGSASSGANSVQLFVAAMWKAYRGATPANFTEDNVATAIWQNASISSQSGAFTVSFDMMASGANIEGVTGLSKGAADAVTDLAAAVRFAPTGMIDAYNGTSYQAGALLTYAAGVNYHVVMSVDVSTKRYSVTVTPAGKAAVTIASNFAFRSQQAAVTALTNVGFLATNGSHAVLGIGLQAASSTVVPIDVSYTTSSPPPPATTTGSAMPTVNLTSSSTWQNLSIPKISGKATLAFDLTPASNAMDGITAVTAGAADAYSDLAVAIRFAPNGRIDAINGKTWSAATSFVYTAGKTYHVSVDIDLAAHKYNATVTPAGGAAVAIASNFAFRAEQASVTSLTNLAVFAAAASHKVTNGATASSGSATTSTASNDKTSSAVSTPSTSGTTSTSSTTTTSSAPSTSGTSSMPAVNVTSSGKWQNLAIPTIAGKVTLAFDVTPAGSAIDAITGVSNGSADAYADLGVVIRFGSNGRIDAINGKTWAAANSVTYSAGKTYRVSVAIDLAGHKYSATVTPAGGAAITLASNWAFRSEQAAVKLLNNLAVFAAAGSHKVTNATLKTN